MEIRSAIDRVRSLTKFHATSPSCPAFDDHSIYPLPEFLHVASQQEYRNRRNTEAKLHFKAEKNFLREAT